MVSWITFAWQIEFIAVAILIYAMVVFLKAIVKLDKDFKIALLFILSSIVINVGLGIMVGVFITSGVGQEKLVDFWILRPIVTLGVAILVMFGARKFFLALQKDKE